MKKLIAVCAVVALMFSLTACESGVYQHSVGNRITSGADVQTFHYAYITAGEKTFEGYIAQWRDYDESDVIQVMLDDGKTYLTHYSNVVMVSDPKLGSGYSSGLVDYN